MLIVVVTIACHFKSRNELCNTTIRRLEAALEASRHLINPRFFVTGNVPYEKGGRPMSILMLEWLTSHGVERRKIHIGDGVGTFSEARNITNAVLPGSNITIVASDWYLWSGRPIWKHFAKEYHHRIAFLKVKSTGSFGTKLFYAAYGFVIRFSYFFGLHTLVERRLAETQSKRIEGFTWDGCGEHSAGR